MLGPGRLLTAFLCGVLALGSATVASAQQQHSDLDAFMQQVLARRDDNWQKLQQYILDEQERMEIRAPDESLVWGQKREFSWFMRDGYFVRSPVRVNGEAVSEADRQKAEARSLETAKAKDIRAALQQRHEPEFISAAYFLKFKFEPGHYALVGHETLGRRDVLKIEYYPQDMFSDDPNTRTERRVRQTAEKKSDAAFQEAIQRLMNKASRITMWVEPTQHQIVKYTFDNVGLDFLPLAWLARLDQMHASMAMIEAFPGIWLPSKIDSAGAVVLASGRFDVRYAIDYANYREATVTTKITGARR